MRVVRLADVPPAAWANGGGITRELMRAETPDGRLRWRVSVAEIASPGPFSPLPGLDRSLVLFEGPAMRLVVDGRPILVRPLQPVTFGGEAAATVPSLDRPVRVLNVMTGRGLARAALRVARPPFRLRGEAALVATGTLAVGGVLLAPGDLVPGTAGGEAAVTGAGEAVVVTFTAP